MTLDHFCRDPLQPPDGVIIRKNSILDLGIFGTVLFNWKKNLPITFVGSFNQSGSCSEIFWDLVIGKLYHENIP